MQKEVNPPQPTRRIIKAFTLAPEEAEWVTQRAAAENRTASNYIETLIINARKTAEAQQASEEVRA